jgi:hypothetical protein
LSGPTTAERGTTIEVTVTADGGSVWFPWTTDGIGQGICPGVLAPDCLGIVGSPSVLGPISVTNGQAVLSIEVDANSPEDIYIQGAVRYNGDWSLSNTLSIDIVDATAGDWTVCASGGEYTTIQDAIDSEPNNATITVCDGTYSENLLIDDKTLTLTAMPGTVEVLGGSNGSVVTVSDGADVTMSGFVLTGGVGDAGGGVRCTGSTLTLENNGLSNNASQTDGGGVYGSDCDVDIRNNQIANNAAANYGGGIYCGDCDGEIDGNTVENNISYEGGGLFVDDGGGGGWFGGSGSTTNIRNNIIRNNEATTIDEESWGGHGGGGGGIWYDGEALIDSNRVESNLSRYNGGGMFTNTASPTVTNNTFLSNTSQEDGAGIYANQGNLYIDGNLFESNISEDDAGGLRLYYGNSTVLNNVLIGNYAPDDGGGMKMSHGQSHEVAFNTFENNQAGDAGGGLELDNDVSDVHDNVFIANDAVRGGGIHLWQNTRNHTIEDNLFERNTASDCGAAAMFDNNPYVATMIHNVMIDNDSSNDGGAVCVDIHIWPVEDAPNEQENYYLPSLIRVQNSLVYDSDASDDGGAFYAKAGTLEVINVTMNNNDAPTGAAAVAKEESEIIFVNTIISQSGGGAVLTVEDGGQFDVSYTNFWDNDGSFSGLNNPIGSNGNIAQNPDYEGDFELANGSACINAGDPSISDTNGSRSDMGAYGGPNGNWN